MRVSSNICYGTNIYLELSAIWLQNDDDLTYNLR